MKPGQKPDPGVVLGAHPSGGVFIYLPKTQAVVHEHAMKDGEKIARRDVVVRFSMCDEQLAEALAWRVPGVLR